MFKRLILLKSLGFDWSVAVLPQGDEVFRQRKMMNQSIGPSHVDKYLPEVLHTVHEMCLNMARFPAEKANWTKL